MQLLFISDEAQVVRFLSGYQAEAIMPQGNAEVSGLSQHSLVTVICSGVSTPYKGTVTRIDTGYPASGNSKWLGLKFMVRRNNAATDHHLDYTTVND